MVAETKRKTYLPGITLRSVGASVFCLLLMGMYVQYAEVILVSSGAMGEQSLPVPALTVIAFLILAAGAARWLLKRELLSRQERFCVLIALLIAAPMMTQGMWHRFVGLLAASPRDGNFHYLDAFNDKLWPHGPNLVEGAFAPGQERFQVTTGGAVAWETAEYAKGQSADLPVLRNGAAGEVATISVTLPVQRDGEFLVMPGQPYLVSFLAKTKGLQESAYFVKLYCDDEPRGQEVITRKDESEATFLHQTGFARIGAYGVVIPKHAERQIRLEIGLEGVGSLIVGDPKLFNVAVLEGVFKGRRIVSEAQYAELGEAERLGLIVKPDNLWSWRGLKSLIAGYIPVRAWLPTAFAWATPILLLLLGLLAIAVLLRRQWAESERYPFPLFQIPYALNGEADEADDRPLAGVWRNKLMWMGLAFGLAYALLKGWYFYNPEVPFKEPKLVLSDLITNPFWGGAWGITFSISLLLLSFCIFFELNVLLSLVIGFLAYRMLFCAGEIFGWKVQAGYPWRYEQAIGAYLGYAAVVVFFMRKYLGKVIADAFLRNREASGGEAMTYRTALMVLALCFAGIAAWAAWLHVSVPAILIYFAFLMTIGFVAAKFKSECGLPAGYFTPYNAMLLVSLVGGMTVFGPDGVLVCLIASGFLTVSVFFFIPGTQMEMLEFGRRYGVVPRHLVYTCLIGILGGLFVGGWVFLSNSYALGGDNINYQWSYSQGWYFRTYMSQLADATTRWKELQNPDAAAVARWWKPEYVAYLGAGSLTVFIAVLRQLFAGFWLHPIGIILGSAHMLEWAWGSCLAAWAIRLVVLKLGGAATVKNKLFPFFIGVFVGCLVSLLVFTAYGYYLQTYHGINSVYSALP